MGNPYTSQSISGYNSSPPSDDGTEVSSNQLNWSKHINKIGNPIKTLTEAIDTAVSSAFGKLSLNNVSAQGSSYTVLNADQGKTIRVTAAATITCPDPATVGAPFMFAVKNDHTAAITISQSGSDTIDGSATYSLPAGQAVILSTDGTDWFISAGYILTGADADEVYVNQQNWTSLASASQVSIGAASSYRVNITGTSTILSFDTVAAGLAREVRFDGALTLTHNATSLILPGGADITTASGDTAKFVSEGSGNWRCLWYSPTDGKAVLSDSITLATPQVTTSGTEFDFTGIPSGTKRVTVVFVDVSLDGTDKILIQLGDSGGIELTGYTSAHIILVGGSVVSSSNGFVFGGSLASRSFNGQYILSLGNSSTNTWIGSGILYDSSGSIIHAAGETSLTTELTQLRITRDGTDNFDAGSVNILYES